MRQLFGSVTIYYSTWICPVGYLRRDNRPGQGRPSIEHFPRPPLSSPTLELPSPVRDIVSNTVPQDVIQCVVRRDILALFPDHDHKFAFIVDFRRLLCKFRDG